MISSHDQASIAVDPFLEIFKLARKVLYKKIMSIPQSAAIPDYFFNNQFIKIYKTLNTQSLNKTVDPNTYQKFLKSHKSRISLQCRELLKHIPKKPEYNLKKLLKTSLFSIQKSRDLMNEKIVGIKDSWIIELFPVLAKTFPDAKFILVIRDPRACIASNYFLKSRKIKANSTSFVRSWRKNLAFASELKSKPKLKNKFLIIKYENLVLKQKATAKKIFRFLGLPFQKKVLNPKNYFDFSKNTTWRSNSSFTTKAQRIYKTSLYRWAKVLPQELLSLVEIISYPELRFLGYKIKTKVYHKKTLQEAIKYIKYENKKRVGWSLNKDFKDEIIKIKLDFKKNFFKNQDKAFNFLFTSHYKNILPFLIKKQVKSI